VKLVDKKEEHEFFYGNKEIWNVERTAFFCSQKCPAMYG